jgi:hypothetical protein
MDIAASCVVTLASRMTSLSASVIFSAGRLWRGLSRRWHRAKRYSAVCLQHHAPALAAQLHHLNG